MEILESLLLQMLEASDVDFPTLGKPSEDLCCPAALLLVCGYLETPELQAGNHHQDQHHDQPAGSCQGAC